MAKRGFFPDFLKARAVRNPKTAYSRKWAVFRTRLTRKLAFSRFGKRVFIKFTNKPDCLSESVAAKLLKVKITSIKRMTGDQFLRNFPSFFRFI